MKKIFVILALFSIFSFTVAAQESEKKGKYDSQFSYVNVPIVKVYEGKDAYVVVYQKNKIGVGKTVVPKKWIHGNAENPRKLKIRTARTADASYMSVVKKNGEFIRVVLNVPVSKQNSLWGVVDYRKPIDGSDKDTLEELDL